MEDLNLQSLGFLWVELVEIKSTNLDDESRVPIMSLVDLPDYPNTLFYCSAILSSFFPTLLSSTNMLNKRFSMVV